MQASQRYYTPEEYLAQEEVAEFRSEYRDGKIVPIADESINHHQIVGNVYAALKFRLCKTDFKPYIGNLRLWIPRHRQYVYPDVLVVQDQPIFQAPQTDPILNPCFIVEVLSKTTKNYDRTDKFRYYRSIPELREYVLINQYKIEIEQYSKTKDDSWLFKAYKANDEKLFLASINTDLSVKDIYEGVDFSSGGA